MTEQLQPTEETVMVPDEYMIEGIGDTVKAMKRMLEDSKRKYGRTYNRNNDYEKFLRTIDTTDHKALLQEYILVRDKKSNLSQRLRAVVKELGENAERHAYLRYLRENGVLKDKPAKKKTASKTKTKTVKKASKTKTKTKKEKAA